MHGYRAVDTRGEFHREFALRKALDNSLSACAEPIPLDRGIFHIAS
jgi:hypothetical protein